MPTCYICGIKYDGSVAVLDTFIIGPQDHAILTRRLQEEIGRMANGLALPEYGRLYRFTDMLAINVAVLAPHGGSSALYYCTEVILAREETDAVCHAAIARAARGERPVHIFDTLQI